MAHLYLRDRSSVYQCALCQKLFVLLADCGVHLAQMRGLSSRLGSSAVDFGAKRGQSLLHGASGVAAVKTWRGLVGVKVAEIAGDYVLTWPGSHFKVPALLLEVLDLGLGFDHGWNSKVLVLTKGVLSRSLLVSWRITSRPRRLSLPDLVLLLLVRRYPADSGIADC